MLRNLVQHFNGQKRSSTPLQQQQRSDPPSTPSQMAPSAKRLDTKLSPARQQQSLPDMTMIAPKNHANAVNRPPGGGNTETPATALLSATDSQPTKFTRTYPTIFLERHQLDLKSKFTPPADFPDAIWPTYNDARRDIERYCADANTCGGSFAIVSNSSKRVANAKSARKGARQLISCACNGASRSKVLDRVTLSRPNKKNYKTGCKWGVWLEEATEGWVISSFNAHTREHGFDCHNHELAATPAEPSQCRRHPRIPDHLVEIAEIWNAGGMKPSTIFYKLSSRETDAPVTYTLKDIENLFPGSIANRALDCSNLYKYLRDRVTEDPRLNFKIDINGDGKLTKVCFVMNGDALDLWEQTDQSVLRFDTEYGTNRDGLKLGLLSCVDANGHTQVLAISFLRSEDTTSFNWVFTWFTDVFGCSPKVIFTNLDRSMEAAIASSWKESAHFLCTFHLWKSFLEHFRSLITDEAIWKQVSHKWWRLCKETDVEMRDEFDDHWQSLVALIKSNCTAAALLAKHEEWLKSINERKQKWAACYTWSQCTFGMHSTARAEALHSSIVHLLSKHSAVIDLVKDIGDMCSEQKMNNKLDNAHQRMVARFNRDIDRKCARNPMVTEIANQLVPFAFNLLDAQASQMIHYDCSKTMNGKYTVTRQCMKVTSAHDDDVDYSSEDTQNEVDYGILATSTYRSHTTTLEGCSCQFPLCWRLPCRHMLRLILHLGSLHAVEILDKFRGIIAPLWFKQSTIPSTKEGRRAFLLESFEALIDKASEREDWTRMVLEAVEFMERELDKLILAEEEEEQGNTSTGGAGGGVAAPTQTD